MGIPKSNNNSKDDLTINMDALKSEFLQTASKISDILIREAESDTNIGWRWKKYFNLPYNTTFHSQYHPGLYFGAAGIGTYFLEMYEYTKNDTYLEAARKAAQYIINRSYYSEEMDWIIWQRAEDSLSAYTSLKYGNAGISHFFLDIYKATQNVTYLQYNEMSLNSLLKIAIPNAKGTDYKWGYNFFGKTPIGDLMYGSAGISSAFLKSYQVTNNETYLDAAIKAVNWVLSLSNVTINTENGTRSILYTTDTTYPYYFTGYSTGASGIADHFLDLYNATKNPDWLIHAIQIGNWLRTNDENGLWSYGGSDFLTENRNEDGTYLSFSAGSAGIGYFFSNLYEYTENPCFLKPISRIKQTLAQEVQIRGDQRFWKDQIQGLDENETTTGLRSGLAGIGLFYAKQYSFFGFEDDLINLIGIHEYFKNITSEDGFIPFDPSINPQNILYDSSYFDGIAGIGHFYLEASKILNNSARYLKTAFDETCQLELVTTTIKTDSNNANFPLSISIAAFFIISLTRRHKKYNRNKN
jgi:lantibiotic modifying enzyme